MTKDEYKRLVLESAADDGELDPPALTDWWLQTGMLMEMYAKGQLERRGPEPRMYDRTGPWYITERGKAALALPAVPPS